jgi:hypothetical protein
MSIHRHLVVVETKEDLVNFRSDDYNGPVVAVLMSELNTLPDCFFDCVYYNGTHESVPLMRFVRPGGRVKFNKRTILWTNVLPFHPSPNNVIETIECLMFMFQKACKDVNCIWWMARGSLLGAVRHCGVIPWATHGSAGVMKGHRHTLEHKVAPLLAVCGVIMEPIWFGYRIGMEKSEQICPRSETFPEFVSYNTPHIDIIVYDTFTDPYGDVFIAPENYHSGLCREGDFFYPSELLPLSEEHFGVDSLLPAPAHPEFYLNRLYGENFMSVASDAHTVQDTGEYVDHQERKPLHFSQIPPLSPPVLGQIRSL